MQQCWLAAIGEMPQANAVCRLRSADKRSWVEANATDMYNDWQCSEGYQDRLCTVCQEGYGASGTPGAEPQAPRSG